MFENFFMENKNRNVREFQNGVCLEIHLGMQKAMHIVDGFQSKWNKIKKRYVSVASR